MAAAVRAVNVSAVIVWKACVNVKHNATANYVVQMAVAEPAEPARTD